MWALLPLFQHEATTGDTTWQKKWFVGKSYTAKSRGARIGVRLVNWISAIILLDIGKKKIFLVFFTFYSRNILYSDIWLDWVNYSNTKTHEWCENVDVKGV